MVLLQNRFYFNRLILVSRQYFSPEKNLYSYQNGMERYKNNTYIHMGLPYYGEWYVSQGYEGNITHKEDWKYALDFVVVDEMKHTFKYPGNELTDYYCYNLPVLAPAAGYIHQCVDDIPDNAIKDVNIEQNWGNTIVIKHTEYLYSKLSHLKPGSLLVKPGEYVTKGQVLAMCGSSGRSPEPHLHFQLQSTPYIGSKTLSYPIAYYISHQAEQTQFHSFSVPDEGELISEPTITPLMSEAFKFIPGNTLIFEVTDGDQKEIVKWNCMVDAWNHTYLYCAKTNSCAYFVNNGVLHYFTEYTGDENALLYQFYLGAYKVLLCYYPSINWNDTLPVHTFYKGIAKLINDITSPFFSLLNIKYEARYTSSNDLVHPGEIAFESNISARTRQLKLGESNYRFVIKNNGIDTIEIRNKNKTIIAKCI
jgi:murein DD-endopeptidase MepM/ murein hydrolase activator NlpD